jgi:hypothetical protein
MVYGVRLLLFLQEKIKDNNNNLGPKGWGRVKRDIKLGK